MSERRGRSVWNLALGTLALVLAAGWFVIGRQSFDRGVETQLKEHLRAAERFFNRELTQRQQRLQAECRLMTDDPRLTSSLSTLGMDRATLEDILAAMRKQTAADGLALLTPDARVRAATGFEGLPGVDLSSAALLRKARESGDAVAGNWVLGEQLFTVAIRAVRVEDQLVAFLVLGSHFTTPSLEAMHEAAGAGAALLIAGKAGATYPPLPFFQEAFTVLSLEVGVLPPQRRAFNSGEALVQVLEVPQTMPPVRLALVRPVESFVAPFSLSRQLFWLPPLLATLLGALAIARGRLLN